jgi:hypothetical protein
MEASTEREAQAKAKTEVERQKKDTDRETDRKEKHHDEINRREQTAPTLSTMRLFMRTRWRQADGWPN